MMADCLAANPPYSSKIKQYIKKHKARTVDELLKVLKKAFDIITFNDAKGYFNHAAEF